MLTTPLGELEVCLDGETLECPYHAIPVNQACPNLNGRYVITVTFHPDRKEHTISCRIRNYTPSGKDSQEPGEHLELSSFYRGSAKLSIGMKGDAGYFNGERLSEYDYDTEYLPDGVQYCVLPITKTTNYHFGAAWINDVTKENDVQTCFGADVTLL